MKEDQMMNRRRSPIRCLMALTTCALWLLSSAAYAQQKLDRVAVGQWREDLRYLVEELLKRHKNLFATLSREQFELAVKRLDEWMEAYLKAGQKALAATSFERALALNPRNWPAADQLRVLRNELKNATAKKD
jgi:hypothetical protein